MPLQYTAIAPRFAVIALAVSLIVTAAGCGKPDSPEQQVRDVIGKMELAAEARDVGGLTEHLSEDYRDPNGLGPEDAVRYVRGYLMTNQSIHLLTRVEQIEFPTEGEARAKVLVGMVGRDADAAGKWDLAADLYEFKIALRHEDGDWKVSFAEWSRR